MYVGFVLILWLNLREKICLESQQTDAKIFKLIIYHQIHFPGGLIPLCLLDPLLLDVQQVPVVSLGEPPPPARGVRIVLHTV